MIYLASPYSHPDPSVRHYRWQVVCRVAARLMIQGHLILSPIAHTHPIAVVGGLSKGWEFWEQYDRVLLEAAKELWVLRLDGWRESAGVRAEIAYAETLDLAVTYIDPTAADLVGAVEMDWVTA